MKDHPICGHWFWDNNNGARAFCDKLGLEYDDYIKVRESYDEDAFLVGKCNSIYDFPNNCKIHNFRRQLSRELGAVGRLVQGAVSYIADAFAGWDAYEYNNCRKGQPAGVSIMCFGSQERSNT